MVQVARVLKAVRHSPTLLSDLTAGLVIGFSEVIIAISLASLIFSGPLEVYLPRGIAIALITAAANIFVTTLRSSNGILSSIQDNPTVLLAVAATSLIGVLSAGPELAATVIALILVTTLLTGGFMLLLGYFGLGGLVRYIPYPVIGGFLAGTGWLLVQGSIGTMADYPLSLTAIPDLLKPEQMLLWVPGLLFGLALFFGVRRVRHFLALPGILLGGLALFYLCLAISGMSVEQAVEHGLLLGTMGGQAVWQPLLIGDLAQANWGALLSQAGNIGAILILTIITLLLNISGLELTFHKDLDLNYELRTAGFANLLSGLAGGMIGYPAVSLTVLSQRIGARGRAAGIMIVAICLIVLVLGASVLAYTPKPLLGGLLLFLGLDFLNEWVIQGYKKLGRLDYGVVLLILGVIATSGFLMGVSVGLVLMVAVFVVNYSRLNIFHRAVAGSELASNVERNAYHRRSLAELGRQIYVLELQGYIFFGTANTVLERCRQRLNDTGEKPLLFLILDFRRVTGLDSSAAFSFAKAKYLADTHRFTLIFTHLTEPMQCELARNGLAAGEGLMIFPDLDRGLEYCENTLLERSQITKMHIPATLQLQLADSGFKKEDTARLKTYLEQVQLAPGVYLIHQGDESADLYFVEVGQVSVYMELENNRRMRLQTLSMGTVVGELGFYLNVPRSASVIADAHSLVYRLTRQSMQDMKTKDPDLAVAFHELMVRLVSERLVAANRERAALNG